MPDPVLLEIKDRVAWVTLNQPDKRNAMRPELLDSFRARIEEIKKADDVRCVVVQGSGSTFCSGADFGAMTGVVKEAGSMEEAVKRIYGSFLIIRELEMPTLAKVNGHAIGGGLGLALACDLRVTSTKAKLGVNFAKLGITPGMATTYILPKLIGLPKAAELFFTGRTIRGDEAEKMGLVNYCWEMEELDAKTEELAKEIAACAPVALKLTKQALYQSQAFDLGAALSLEARSQAKTMAMNDSREGILAMMQKREPNFKGT